MEKTQTTEKPDQPTRRKFLGKLNLILFLGIVLSQGWITLKTLLAPGLQQPPTRFTLGKPSDFPDGVTFVEKAKVFVERKDDALRAISAVCTHLGCTLQFQQADPGDHPREFRCPCHRSRFATDGENIAGPATKPLAYYQLTMDSQSSQLAVDLSQPVDPDQRLMLS